MALQASTTSIPETKQHVSYFGLPHKKQLAVLCFARLADPLATFSLQSYVFHQLKWFDPTKSDAEIAAQAGVVIASKTLAEVCVGLLWGRLADSALFGRKMTLMTGLLTSAISTIGYGLSRSFVTAVAWQMIGGAFNGNIATVRCIVSELNHDRAYRVRAMMLLPICANVGNLLGPLAGGFLSFTPGNNGVHRYPFLLPNLVIGGLYLLALIGIVVLLEETHDSIARDRAQAPLSRLCKRLRGKHILPDPASRDLLQTREERYLSERDPLLQASGHSASKAHSRTTNRGGFWTRNVIMTISTLFLVGGHVSSFQSLWAIFLSSPAKGRQVGLSKSNSFAGGIGLKPSAVGVAMSSLGLISLVLQTTIYPTLNDRYGTVGLWRKALALFPPVYILAPLASLFVGSEGLQEPLLWASLVLVTLAFVLGRSGVTPATSLLLADCTPNSSARATTLAAGTMAGNLARSLFPIMTMFLYGLGLSKGIVGIGFWWLAAVALLSCWMSRWVKDGVHIEIKPGAV